MLDFVYRYETMTPSAGSHVSHTTLDYYADKRLRIITHFGDEVPNFIRTHGYDNTANGVPERYTSAKDLGVLDDDVSYQYDDQNQITDASNT